MTIKELRQQLSLFKDDDLVLIRGNSVDSGYYENFRAGMFNSDSNICVIAPSHPYVKIPFNVIEAGWRPSGNKTSTS